MGPIHEAIIKQVRNTYKGDNPDFTHLLVTKSDQDLCRLYFGNVRMSGDEFVGLRLTVIGLKTLRRCFASWTLRMTFDFKPKPYHLLYFDRTCEMPWYLDAFSLVLFDAKLAMKARLVGDIDSLITAFV